MSARAGAFSPRSALPALAVGVLVPLALGGCLGVETTQDKSAKKAAEAKHAISDQEGLVVARSNRQVEVEDSAVVQDANGVAAVVRLRNTGATQVELPVAIRVTDRQGRKLYANDIPGLDQSLVSLPVLRRGQSAYWVNNQILVSGRAAAVAAKVGVGHEAGGAHAAAAAVPRIAVSGVRLGRDADGTYAKGEVRNTSPVLQRRLTVTCVAVAGGHVRAAGRAVVEKLPPAGAAGKPTPFTVFFIGDPKGARVACEAPPTVLPKGAAK